jgi:hypothetical protein
MPKKKFQEECGLPKVRRIGRDKNGIPFSIRIDVHYIMSSRGYIDYDEDEMRGQYENAFYALPDRKNGPDND